MNLCIFKNGRICFSNNLYYSSRPPEFFLPSHWMTPAGMMIPMGAPATVMRDYLFGHDVKVQRDMHNCHTAILIEPSGRCCSVEFQGNGEEMVFKNYQAVENDNAWVQADDFQLAQYAAAFLPLVEKPKDMLPLITRLQEFVVAGFVEYSYSALVKLVQETIGQFEPMPAKTEGIEGKVNGYKLPRSSLQRR
jgi:hypothetical protein